MARHFSKVEEPMNCDWVVRSVLQCLKPLYYYPSRCLCLGLWTVQCILNTSINARWCPSVIQLLRPVVSWLLSVSYALHPTHQPVVPLPSQLCMCQSQALLSLSSKPQCPGPCHLHLDHCVNQQRAPPAPVSFQSAGYPEWFFTREIWSCQILVQWHQWLLMIVGRNPKVPYHSRDPACGLFPFPSFISLPLLPLLPFHLPLSLSYGDTCDSIYHWTQTAQNKLLLSRPLT